MLANELAEYYTNVNSNYYKQEIKKKIGEIIERKRGIYQLLNLDLFQTIPPEFEVIPTAVIKYNPVYNKIYKLYLEFNSYCIPYDSGELNLQSLNEWLLYELWVFFEVFKQCCEKFGRDFETENLFKEENGRIKLKIGEFEKSIGEFEKDMEKEVLR